MKKMIAVKVDVSKVDKTKLFEGKNGAKYLDLVLIETPGSKYGDWMAVQGVSMEDRKAGIRGEILGNGKNLVSKASSPTPVSAPDSKPEDTTDVPF